MAGLRWRRYENRNVILAFYQLQSPTNDDRLKTWIELLLITRSFIPSFSKGIVLSYDKSIWFTNKADKTQKNKIDTN